MKPDLSDTVTHASAVAVGSCGVLISGSSGSGKSALALQLMAFGAQLIADDRTKLDRVGDAVWATRPDTLPQAIEARGVGVLTAKTCGTTPIVLVVDLDISVDTRMPEPSEAILVGLPITKWGKVDAPHFPAAIFHYLKTMDDTHATDHSL